MGDTCDENPQMTAQLYHGSCDDGDADLIGDVDQFPEYTAGNYHITYVCTDGAGHTDSACRDVQNVDHTLPIIQILGSDHMTLEATHMGNYVDDGATCSDQVDGVISQNVEVSGDVVNLSKVGTYVITYNCKDSAGNSAPRRSALCMWPRPRARRARSLARKTRTSRSTKPVSNTPTRALCAQIPLTVTSPRTSRTAATSSSTATTKPVPRALSTTSPNTS